MERKTNYPALIPVLENNTHSLVRTMLDNSLTHTIRHSYPATEGLLLEAFRELVNFINHLNNAEDTDTDLYLSIELMNSDMIDGKYGHPNFVIDKENQTILITVDAEVPDDDEEGECFTHFPVSIEGINTISLGYGT